MITIKKGLNIPVVGEPRQKVEPGPSIRTVAVLGCDFIGMKPTMFVREGDAVKIGQPLFEDKKNPGVCYTAPAAGVVAQINRGHKRVLQSIVIDVSKDEAHQKFEHYTGRDIEQISAETARNLLLESGQWVAFRTRPFSKTPAPQSSPKSIFITATDTNPLAADPEKVIREFPEKFKAGLKVLRKLTSGKLHLCQAPASTIPSVQGVSVTEFKGPHPAGLVGTHIHFLAPASLDNPVWHLNYQDVIAIGHLFMTGQIWCERIISLAGPQVEDPRLVITRLGASTDELTAGQLQVGDNRIISGSVLSGRTARGPFAFLGRYHLQVSVLLEGRKRGLLEYLWPGAQKHSALNIFTSKLDAQRKFSMTTSTQGSPRAMVPVGVYEKVMPLDLLPTQLLRALIVGDTEMAQALGCLELDEEDLALCTYVCPGKYEYGPILRDNLNLIEKEG